MKRFSLLLLFIATSLLYHPNATHAQVIVTVAGTGVWGYSGDGGPAKDAELNAPYGIVLDDNGNLYICDEVNGRIRKVSPSYGGTITTVVGNGFSGYSGDNGPAINATVRGVYDLAVDNKGNLYLADAGNNCIRKVAHDTITTIAGTGVAGYNGDSILAASAELNGPLGVAIDSVGNIYIVDADNYRIRKVDTAGIITTIAGTGIGGFSRDGSRADTAKLDSLSAILKLDEKNDIFFADNIRIRKIDKTGIITTIAGNGIRGYSGDGGLAIAAEIDGGGGIAIDKAGNVFIADNDNNRIRMVDATGIITTIAGGGLSEKDNIDPLLALIACPTGITANDSGDIYISTTCRDRIRLITKHPNSVSNISKAQGIDIYPNPSDGNFTVHMTSNINEPMQIAITDVLGVQLRTYTGNTNSPLQITSGLPPGIYLLSVTTESRAYTQRLIIR